MPTLYNQMKSKPWHCSSRYPIDRKAKERREQESIMRTPFQESFFTDGGI